MLSVANFLAQLPEAEHLALGNAIGAGLHDARLAAQCLTDPSRQAENVAQLLAYLNGAITRLSAAREIVQHYG
jgi:hypothetical protein